MSGTLLITGGAGYIGSHALIEFVAQGYRPIVFDNFSNSTIEGIRRVERIVGQPITAVAADVRDAEALDREFEDARSADAPVVGVVHIAGARAGDGSMQVSAAHYRDDVEGTAAVLEAMDRHGVKAIVFSSSARVYGVPDVSPVDESHPVAPTDAYGQSKAMAESLLADWAARGEGRSAVSLRYFNSVGAHEGGTVGVDPGQVADSPFALVAQVAMGLREPLVIPDAGGHAHDDSDVSDYLHVADLARGHAAALAYAFERDGYAVFNLGTGQGASLGQVVEQFAAVTGRPVPCVTVPRQSGGRVVAYAAVGKANTHLRWAAVKSLADMCADAWRWQSANPHGYRSQS